MVLVNYNNSSRTRISNEFIQYRRVRAYNLNGEVWNISKTKTLFVQRCPLQLEYVQKGFIDIKIRGE